MGITKDEAQLIVKVNGKLADKTFGDLVKSATTLKKQIKGLKPGSDEFVEASKKLKSVNNRLAEIRGSTRGVTDAQKKAAKATTLWGRAFQAVTIVGFFALAERAARGFFSFLFTRTSELDGISRRFESVFGDSASTVEAWAEQNAISIGVTINEYKKLAAASGDLLVPIGFQRDQAAALSKEMLDLAAALAIAEGGTKSTAEVSEILNKALVGEREQLKTLGVVIQEADVKLRLAEKGQAKFTGQALKQAKALATLEIITENSADAITQFDTSQDSTALTTARITAKIKNKADTLAKKLLPVLRLAQIALENIVDTSIRFIDVLIATPRFIIENRDTLVALTIALISFNANTIVASASALGMVAAQKLAVVWNKRAAFSFKALNLVMKANPIGFIIGLVATLTAGFISLYKRSERVRGTIAGLSQVAQLAWQRIQEGFKQMVRGAKIFAKELDLAISIKSSTRKRLRAEIKALKDEAAEAKKSGGTIAEAFNKGYDDKIEEEQREREAKRTRATPVINNAPPVIQASDIIKDIKVDPSKETSDKENSKKKTNTGKSKDFIFEGYQKIIAQAKKNADERIAISKAASQVELDDLETQFLTKLLTEEEYNLLFLQQKIDNKNAELEVLAALGFKGTQTYRDQELEKLRFEKELSDERIVIAKREASIKAELDKLQKQGYSELLDASIDTLKADEKAKKKYASAIKAFEIAKIIVNAESEASGYFRTYATVPGGQFIAAGLSVLAGIRAVSAINKVKGQKFANGGGVMLGGRSHSQGGTQAYFSDGTTAEMEAGEMMYIVNKQDSRKLAFLENANRGIFADGGSIDIGSRAPRNIPRSDIAPSASIAPHVNMDELKVILSGFAKSVDHSVKNIVAKVVYEQLVETANDLSDVQDASSL